MVLTGAAVLWETALGSSLELSNVILVGARDLDPPERDLICPGKITLVPPGESLRCTTRTHAVHCHFQSMPCLIMSQLHQCMTGPFPKDAF